MNKKILAVIIAVALAFCTLSFAACNNVKIEIIKPDGGYKVTPGGSVTIQYEAANKGVVSFSILEGEEYAESITNGGLLTVKAEGKQIVGKTIKVVATLTEGEKIFTAEAVVTIVDIKLTAINNLSLPWEYVFPGEGADGELELSYTLVPANTTQDDIQFEIVSGQATVDADGKLKVSESAGEGEIKVRAYCGDVSSEILSIPVELPSNDPHVLSITGDSVTVENGPAAQPVVTVRVNNDQNGSPVTDATVYFVVSKGSQYLSVTSEGYSCYLNLLGHGQAEVTAKLRNGKKLTIDVTCIKTPSRLELPEFLRGKNSINYTTGVNQEFDFAVVVPQEGSDSLSCRDVVYSFENLSAGAGTEQFVTYEGGKLKFNTTGSVKATVTTDSKNSNGEVSVSRIFTVNEGINVSTWEELKAALENASNKGKDINIVATQALTDKALTKYGCNLVPRLILDDNNKNAGEIAEAISINCQVALFLNGNGHAINFSRLRYVEGWNNRQTSALLFRSGNEGADPGFAVNIKDLVLYGNAGIAGRNLVDDKEYRQNVTETDGEIVGVHEAAIEIGIESKESYYDVNIENVKVYSFSTGIQINRALPGSKCSSMEFDDMFKNCIRAAASILELKDINFGNYGGFALEPSHRNSQNAKDAGGNAINQQITLSGDIKVPNKNAGNTRYFNGFKFMGAPMIEIINGVLANSVPKLTDTQLSHVQNQSGEISFFIFILLDPIDPASSNASKIFIDGMAAAKDIETVRTDVRFVEVPININLPTLGDLGRMIFANLNYQP